MTTAKITAPPGQPSVSIIREFNAPRSLVFRAFTEPDLLVQWLGPRRFKMEIDRYEVRDGGRWRYTQGEPAGPAYGFHGVFHGTPSPDTMVQTFEFEGAPGSVQLDTLHLEERGGKTTARLNSVFQSVEARNAMVAGGMEAGMNEGFERLDELLAKLGREAATSSAR